eukprot:SAG31_NODE_11143_length_1061_cov_1.251559_1_plen_166_part_10
MGLIGTCCNQSESRPAAWRSAARVRDSSSGGGGPLTSAPSAQRLASIQAWAAAPGERTKDAEQRRYADELNAEQPRAAHRAARRGCVPPHAAASPAPSPGPAPSPRSHHPRPATNAPNAGPERRRRGLGWRERLKDSAQRGITCRFAARSTSASAAAASARACCAS